MTVNEQKIRSYASQWESYRQRRRLALVLLYGLVPCWIISFVVLDDLFHLEVLPLLLTAVWSAGACASFWWAGQFRCPRCCRRFGALGSKGFLGGLFFGVFDDICHNCKLRKSPTPTKSPH